MFTLLFVVAFSQSPDTKADVFQHDPLRRIMPALKESLPPSQTLLRELTKQARYDEIADEFKRRSAAWSVDKSVQLVGMGALLNLVANTPVLPESKQWVYGKADDRIREICRPHVEPIVRSDLSIPAAPELLTAQIVTALNFVLVTRDRDPEKVKQVAYRREVLQPVIRIWGRVIRTCLVYKEIYSEEKMSALNKGESFLEVPALPANIESHVTTAGMAPEGIKDLQARKEYEAYLKNVRGVHERYRAVKDVYQLRKHHLDTIRQKLEYLYGEDRTKWEELRQLVTETIKEPEVAQLVIKDFTRRKEPGIWP